MTKDGDTGAVRIRVERLGGFAGFGVGHLKSEGVMDFADLAPPDQKRVQALLNEGLTIAAQKQPGERFRITRSDSQGETSVTVHGDELPLVLRASVKDTLE